MRGLATGLVATLNPEKLSLLMVSMDASRLLASQPQGGTTSTVRSKEFCIFVSGVLHPPWVTLLLTHGLKPLAPAGQAHLFAAGELAAVLFHYLPDIKNILNLMKDGEFHDGMRHFFLVMGTSHSGLLWIWWGKQRWSFPGVRGQDCANEEQ